ncbi:helix-turn-helix domain-containing protein [Streptomyces sp. NBC_00046]|uniref:helix-turn-helix domain-containing protein n=1 Tax=unclassified Streptomyces TaxID=2593676 RepID=UPI0038662FF1
MATEGRGCLRRGARTSRGGPTFRQAAGGFSQADIARYTGRSKTTVSNVFSGRKVQPWETVLDVALALGMRMPASNTTQEQLLDEPSERFRVLWMAAKAEEHEEPGCAPAGGRACPPAQLHPRGRLPAAARQLLFSLTSVCATGTSRSTQRADRDSVRQPSAASTPRR